MFYYSRLWPRSKLRRHPSPKLKLIVARARPPGPILIRKSSYFTRHRNTWYHLNSLCWVTACRPFNAEPPPRSGTAPKTLTKKSGEFAEKMRGNSSVILHRLLVRRQVSNLNSTNIAKSLISPSANNTTVTKIPSFRNYIAASSSQSQSQMLPSLQFHRTLFSSPDGTLLFLFF